MMTATHTNPASTSATDPYSAEVLESPYEFYAKLRETPALFLDKYGVYAFGRDAEVRHILEDWRTFISGAGVGPVNLQTNPPTWWKPGILEVDPPIHTRMREAMTDVISPRKLRPLRAGFVEAAKQLIDEHLAAGDTIDVAALAKQFTLHVFGDAVGIPREGRDPNLVLQGAMNFSRFGPENEIAKRHLDAATGVLDWVMEACDRENLDSSGLGAQIWEHADAGAIPADEARLLVRALLSAGFDTTIFALTNTLVALSDAPEQYSKIRENPRLIKFAVDESLRYDTPFQSFYRTAATDTEVGGVRIAGGEKVLIFPASANRDIEKWGDTAAEFDIDRDASGHLTFGMGIHQCVGQPISRMEIDAFLSEFVNRVAKFEPAERPTPFIHTTLKSYTSASMRVDLV